MKIALRNCNAKLLNDPKEIKSISWRKSEIPPDKKKSS